MRTRSGNCEKFRTKPYDKCTRKSCEEPEEWGHRHIGSGVESNVYSYCRVCHVERRLRGWQHMSMTGSYYCCDIIECTKNQEEWVQMRIKKACEKLKRKE